MEKLMETLNVDQLLKQVEKLSLLEKISLSAKIRDLISLQTENKEDFYFDKLVCHTERSEYADEYIREIRENDRF